MGKQMDYDEVVKWIDNRVALLEHDRKLLQKRMHGAPPGNLAIYQIQGYKRYYQRISSGEEAGRRYLSAGNPLVFELAQKGYNQEALKAVELERKIWMRAGRSLKKLTVRRERVYGNLSVDRRSLVRPLTLTSEMRKAAWEAQEYEPYLNHPEKLKFETRQGPLVRSKSEAHISDSLFYEHIPFKYECPLHFVVHREGTVELLPDKINGQLPLEYEDMGKPYVVDNRTSGSLSSTAEERLDLKRLERDRTAARKDNSRQEGEAEWTATQRENCGQQGGTAHQQLKKGDRLVTLHPDFTIYVPSEDKVYYWEHNGVLTDPDYAAGYVRKLSLYRRAGLLKSGQLILTYEFDGHSLDYGEVNSIIVALTRHFPKKESTYE